ncbi:MAG: NAD(P)/FAD-dependent oxidoreductase [Acidobacteria bacterium]|nr:NAD(P)/FAD-dependent oxidoreductase [Acidobacteriota bacterium]
MADKACVIGSGPNGLAAAIVLAQAGLEVDVFEAQATPGGAVRTMELTLPGFLHDFGSAVYPLGAASPFFSSLPLVAHGLEWIHSPVPLAHPFDDGSSALLESDLTDMQSSLGEDGKAWVKLLRAFVEHWHELFCEVLRPPTFPKHPWLMARFARAAFRSAAGIAAHFRSPRTRALWAGLAAHSFLSLDEPLSGAFAMLMAVPAHSVGWPIPRGGAQSLTNALCRYLGALGGRVRTSSPVTSISSLPAYDLFLCDVTPKQLLALGGERFSSSYRRGLRKYQYGPGVFKVDYALSTPIPWKSSACLRAATVHLGGTFEEIRASEKAMRAGTVSDHPFVLLSQPSLFDDSRAPAGKHTAWAYCHVPHGSKIDMLPRLEKQIERFAPGFQDRVLGKRVLYPADLETMDANLVGGDIQGGPLDLRHFLFRPSWRRYSTSAPDIYICSASTPPGGGVHGMCGYHAAQLALSRSQPRS